MAGGKSWTPKWLRFDNSYFELPGKPEPDQLIAFPTDLVLETDPGFKPYFDKYAASEAAFFADYAAAHKKLSELGSKFSPPEGIRI
jgi:L-ascorbate peroxidase